VSGQEVDAAFPVLAEKTVGPSSGSGATTGDKPVESGQEVVRAATADWPASDEVVEEASDTLTKAML
jgi:hypothetical protein